MTTWKLTPASEIEAHTLAQRETFAAQIFAYEKIFREIKDAATNGLAYVRIGQTYEPSDTTLAPIELPVTLLKTKAAKQLVKKLKAGGYTVKEVAAAERERDEHGRETGAFIAYDVMRISWSAVTIRSGGDEMPAD
ncbi:MAG: hypothetical protein AAFR02_01090 [Pseudomonadota bacterium]